MIKIRSIHFHDHPILKNLTLDFCDVNGNAVDTVIIAGENGAGKSTVLNVLYDLSNNKVDYEMDLIFEKDGLPMQLKYYYNNRFRHFWVKDGHGMDTIPGSDEYKKVLNMSGIYSDVDINFQAPDVSSVTSMSLDASTVSRRSSNELPKQIKQLIIDIQALDDAELSRAMRDHPDKSKNELNVRERMPRFTNAFSQMFDGLTYERIDNVNGHKEIYFKKNSISIPIDKLSSGEKQVVYRGCFLLKDVNATNGAFVFIDEPEISLHPSWQTKILDYYKGIFTNASRVQTSQIFTVTHSPFVIHNENRKNDKVIVLARDDNGDIIVKDKVEYYKCNSIEAVADAFSIKSFSAEQPTVYLEGRTDEIYFNKALSVYGISAPFCFKWIGYIDSKGQEANTGKDALNKALPFLIGRNLPTVNFCLYDCDTNKPQSITNNVVALSIPKYTNDRNIRVGIENALVFDDIDIEPFRKQRVETDDYGIEKRIPEFQKMACCTYICSLPTERLEKAFIHLKEAINILITTYNEINTI